MLAERVAEAPQQAAQQVLLCLVAEVRDVIQKLGANADCFDLAAEHKVAHAPEVVADIIREAAGGNHHIFEP